MENIFVKNIVEKNITIGFRTKITGGKYTLRIAASNTYRVFVNGVFLCYGPMRSAHGYSNIAEYPFFCAEKDVFVTVEVADYHINTYYTVLEDAFFSCEIIRDGRIVATEKDFQAFLLNDRIKKVAKFSVQRPFAEIYDMQKPRDLFYRGENIFPVVKTQRVSGNKLLKCDLTMPKFEKMYAIKKIENGGVVINPENDIQDFFMFYQNDAEDFRAFKKEELESDIMRDISYLTYTDQIENEKQFFETYEFEANISGFLGFTAEVKEDSTIYAIFDEIFPLIPVRMKTVNAVKWDLKKGKYNLLSFEPYTLKYLRIVVVGKADIGSPYIITYENPDVLPQKKYKDEEINCIYEAAVRTFKQNAVDVLTDCPSRERAGWLCDTYFTARSEKLLTGKNIVEKNFLNNILLSPEPIKNLPLGMLPMCYPADHYNGNFIVNWALWLIVELKDYLKRTGDFLLIENFKHKIYLLLKYLSEFENEFYLLENLEKYLFVEWSKANSFLDGVNFPTNMLYSYALNAAGELYQDFVLIEKASKIKQYILSHAFNGRFFVDNALRENGELKNTENTTETCQYYAFYFNIADKNNMPELYKTMFDVINKNNVQSLFPELHPSKPFIGNFLRLDYLAKEGRLQQVLKECKDYFLYMAKRTETLWEHADVIASCNHGFASMVAEWIDMAEKKGILSKSL